MVALQETHLMDGQLQKFSLFVQDFDIFVSNGTSNSAGVLTVVCQNVGIKVMLLHKIPGHALILDLFCQNTSW